MGVVVLGGFFLLVAMVFALAVAATELSFTAEYGFGPGFFPSLVIAAMALLSIVLILEYGRKDRRRLEYGAIRASVRAIAPPVGCLLFAGLFLEVLGFLILSFLMVAVLLLSSRAQRPLVVVGVSAAFSMSVYVLFVRLLSVSLGRGILGF